MADIAERPAKRRRRSTVAEQPRHPDTAAVISEELTAALLDRANARILQTVGFSGATKLAQERLRELAEDYYISMLDDISRLAHAQRRTRPTIVDIQQMFLLKHIPTSSLQDELHRVPSLIPQPLFPPPPQSAEEKQLLLRPDTLRELLGNELDGGNDRRGYIPDHLPPFPSKHTYLETPVFTERPREPRVIREMATEEARLAENALRKILAAAAGGNNTKGKKMPITSTESTHAEEGGGGKGKVGTGSAKGDVASSAIMKRKKRDEVWERTFSALKNTEEGDAKMVNGTRDFPFVHSGKGKGKDAVNGADANIWLEMTVNADSQYWRGGGNKAVKGNRPL